MLPTQEYDPQRGWHTVNASFRQYGSPQESAADWWRLMQKPRYGQVIGSQSFEDAARAIGSSGYATDPAYSQKVLGLAPRNEDQQAFLDQRKRELIAVGAPPHLAELGARQSAIETGWGRSLAGGGNYFGIKGEPGARTGTTMDYEQLPDIMLQSPFAGGQEPPLGPQPLGMAPTPAQPPQLAPEAASAAHGGGFWNNLMGDPLWNIGLGILAAPGYGGNWLRGAATGAQQGMLAHQQRQKFEEELAAAAEERRIKRAKMEATELYAKQFDKIDPVKAAMIRAGAASQLPNYGVTPHYERGPDGKLYAVQYGSDGTVRRTQIEGTPFAVEKTQPGYLGEQERAKVTAREQAEADVQFRQNAPGDIAKLEDTMATVERLAKLPARTQATGWEARLPTFMPRTRDYEVALDQLKGQQFLSMIPQMRGMGALSNAEGDALRAAASDINLQQSDEEHMRSLAIVYANLARARRRVEDKMMLSPDERGKVGPANQADIEAAHMQLFGQPIAGEHARRVQAEQRGAQTGGTMEGGVTIRRIGD
jgi:hypothetical protein